MRITMRKCAIALTVTLCTGMIAPMPVQAAVQDGWVEVDGVNYWYENGERQGVKYNADGSIDESYRGKEIYDPDSDAWYWLDNVQEGAVAKSKDVYQESEAGAWGDNTGEDGKTYGKWVRYDESGHMVKGWQKTEAGIYYFDLTYGTMAKGKAVIDGVSYIFNKDTGILESEEPSDDDGISFFVDGWHKVNGTDYWYEGGVRQGVKYNADGSIDESYRGKEIYDPASDAWYWLDNVQQGAVAKSKDVYQESEAGAWGDTEGEDGKTYGKWVRYDENGHMVKGWQTTEDGTYYFDPVYGTMAKGIAAIDGAKYYFDAAWGILIKGTTVKVDGREYICGEDGKIQPQIILNKTKEYNLSGTLIIEREYDTNGNEVKVTKYNADGSVFCWFELEYNANGDVTKDIVYEKDGSVLSWCEMEYNANGNVTKYIRYKKDGSVDSWDEIEYDLYGDQAKFTRYNADGSILAWSEYEYDENDLLVKYTLYYSKESEGVCVEYVYDENGNLIKRNKYLPNVGYDGCSEYEYDTERNVVIKTDYTASNSRIKQTEYDTDGNKIICKYPNPIGSSTGWVSTEYDDYGNEVKSTYYNENGSIEYITEYEYDTNGNMIKSTRHDLNGTLLSSAEWKYDAKGNETEYKFYNSDGSSFTWCRREYDDLGNLIRSLFYNSDGSVDFIQENYSNYNYEYDDNGNVVKFIVYATTNFIDYHVYKEIEYDKAGNKVKEKVNWSDGSLRFETGYDSYGKVIKKVSYNSDGTLISWYEYEYSYE